MKKIFTICFLAVLSLQAIAQTSPIGNGEIRLSYGILPVQEIGTLLGDGIFMGVVGRKVDESKGSGAVSAGYSYNLTPRLSVGADLFWSSTKVTYKDELGDSKWNVYGGLLNAKYTYLNKNKFQLYGKGGVGYAQYSNKEGNIANNFGNVAYQVSPVGVKYGDKIAVYAEFGVGYLGVANAGIAIGI